MITIILVLATGWMWCGCARSLGRVRRCEWLEGKRERARRAAFIGALNGHSGNTNFTRHIAICPNLVRWLAKSLISITVASATRRSVTSATQKRSSSKRRRVSEQNPPPLSPPSSASLPVRSRGCEHVLRDREAESRGKSLVKKLDRRVESAS